ncbi:MAG: phosphoribosyl-ATP diphosphatase [Raoultibacter sp.]
MSQKTFVPNGEVPPSSQIGATLESLASTIAARRGADGASYTHRLLTGPADEPLKKVMEEAGETALAAKDVDAGLEGAVDHLRYEAADVVYHLLVVLERYGIPLDEFAAELNTRMTETERPEGALRLYEEFVKRGK